MAARAEHKMNVAVVGDREVVITRQFDAPRDILFKALSSCAHMKHWWGPARNTWVSCEMDFRVGGKWRIVLRGPNGHDYAFFGVYREIVPPARISQTFGFAGAPGEIIETMVLTEADGVTTLTVNSLSPSKEARDGMLNSGMEKGAAETYDRLEEYARTLAP
jgi:uncharacterized protein YndB with AHSA1/START domain